MPTTVDPSTFKSNIGPLPRMPYRVQILEVKQDTNAKKKCAQDLFELEIVSPDTVTYEGVETVAAGRKFRMYATYSQANLLNVRQIMDKLGITAESWSIPTEEEVMSGQVTTVEEIQSQTKYTVGKQFDVTLQTSPSFKRLPPKPGQTKWDADFDLGSDGKVQIAGHNINFISADDIISPLAQSSPTITNIKRTAHRGFYWSSVGSFLRLIKSNTTC